MPKARKHVAAGFNLRNSVPNEPSVPNGTTADGHLAVVPFGTSYPTSQNPVG
ncbi:hypothetical protein ACQVTT_30595 [Bacillus mycoides]|uniref:hypothetical protein n=1 Tax=Bacillus mycoides TaxID=1405 RepID=UPI003D649D0C